MMIFSRLNLAYFTHQLERELKNTSNYSCASFEASCKHEHYRIRRLSNLCFFDRGLVVHMLLRKAMPMLFDKLMQTIVWYLLRPVFLTFCRHLMYVPMHIFMDNLMQMRWYLLSPMYLFYRLRLMLMHMFLLMLMLMLMLMLLHMFLLILLNVFMVMLKLLCLVMSFMIMIKNLCSMVRM